jgi:hypothetical protein
MLPDAVIATNVSDRARDATTPDLLLSVGTLSSSGAAEA